MSAKRQDRFGRRRVGTAISLGVLRMRAEAGNMESRLSFRREQLAVGRAGEPVHNKLSVVGQGLRMDPVCLARGRSV